MGIDSLNTNYNWFMPTAPAQSASTDTFSQFGLFNGYFPKTNPFNFGFFGGDFLSLMMQQQNDLMAMFMAIPNGFNVGAPNFKNFSGYSSGELRQKVASMPLSKASAAKIKSIASRLNCDPKDLAAVIYAESGGNAKAVNRQSGATGLIQFMPKTAQWLGTSTQELYNMPAEQQLDYVEKYLATMKNSAVRSGKLDPKAKISSGDLYALVFMPAKVGQKVVCTGGKALAQNRGLSKNGIITNDSLSAKVRQYWSAAEKLFA